MANFYDYEVDPFNSDTPCYLHLQSSYYGGSISAISVPSSPNYPHVLAGTPSRYFIHTNYIIDVSALSTTRPILLYDSSSSLSLTRVTGSPNANQYRVVTDTSSKRRGIIEVHSTQAGHKIDFDLYIIGGIGTDNEFNFYKSKKIITGLNMSNGTDTNHDIDFTSGVAYNQTEGVYITIGALTKQLDAAFATGTNAGMLDAGTIAIDTDYYIYAIGKNNDPLVGDIIASTNATTPSLPAGWTNYTKIGVCQTDGSGNIRQGQWIRSNDKLYFRHKTFILDRALAVINTANRVLVTITAPVSSKIFLNMTGYQDDLYVSPRYSYLTYGETYETDVSPSSIDTCKMVFTSTYETASSSQVNIRDSIETVLYVDSSKQMYIRTNNANHCFLSIKTLGWEVVL